MLDPFSNHLFLEVSYYLRYFPAVFFCKKTVVSVEVIPGFGRDRRAKVLWFSDRAYIARRFVIGQHVKSVHIF